MIFISRRDNEKIKDAMDYIAQLPFGDWQITIEPYKASKTTQQRKYYHALLKIISDYSGDDIDDLKTRMCDTLGYMKTVRLRNGKELLTRRSTETLTRQEYSDMIKTAQMACMHLELKYPDPRDLGLDI